MNKYFKFIVESDLGVGTQYIEFGDDNWAIRQVEYHGGRWFNSSKKKYHEELGGIALFDQQLTEAGMKLGEQIEAEEFELVWNSSIVVSSHSFSKETVPSRSMMGSSTVMKQTHLETGKAVIIPKVTKQQQVFFKHEQSQEKLSLKPLEWKLTLLFVSIGFCFGLYAHNYKTITNVIKTGANVTNNTSVSIDPDSSYVANSPVKSRNEPITFYCNQNANSVVMVGRTGKTERPILNLSKWNNGYSPLNRCQIISNKIKVYINNDRTIAITTGVKNGYDIICLSERVGKGCLKDENNGQILTLGKSGTHSRQKYLENLIASDPKEIRDVFTESAITTSSRVYIDLYKLIQDGRDYYKIDPS